MPSEALLLWDAQGPTVYPVIQGPSDLTPNLLIDLSIMDSHTYPELQMSYPACPSTSPQNFLSLPSPWGVSLLVCGFLTPFSGHDSNSVPPGRWPGTF